MKYLYTFLIFLSFCRYSNCGITVIFLNPHKDPNEEDLKIWKVKKTDEIMKNLHPEKAIFIVSNLAKEFCQMCVKERNIYSQYINSEENELVWKPVVEGLREICDECSTKIFNYHFMCKICGFSVCTECRMEKCGTAAGYYVCLLCDSGNEHMPAKLTLAQIIPEKLLEELSHEMHTIQELWNIPYECNCSLRKVSSSPKEIVSELFILEQDNAEYMYNKKLIR